MTNSNMKSFLNQLQHASIEAAIEAAELRTSGEIRVMIHPGESTNPVESAAREFTRRGMHETAHRNAVLIFVAPNARTFAIHADKAIYENCGPAFWSEIASSMEADFRAGRFTEGIVAALATTGRELARQFPHGGNDKNELPNKVIDEG